MRKISFVIPCYRSKETIESVVVEIKETIQLNELYEYEIILVNDSSPDNVMEVLYKLAKKDLLPRYYIKSGLFETIFGSNTIDIKPTGSIEMDLGLRYTKQDNPAFSPRNRSIIAFDFNQIFYRPICSLMAVGSAFSDLD